VHVLIGANHSVQDAIHEGAEVAIIAGICAMPEEKSVYAALKGPVRHQNASVLKSIHIRLSLGSSDTPIDAAHVQGQRTLAGRQ